MRGTRVAQVGGRRSRRALLRTAGRAAVGAAGLALLGCGGEGAQQFGGVDGGMCSTGRMQSPIDLRDAQERTVPRLRFDYRSEAVEIDHRERTPHTRYAGGDILSIAQHRLRLLQFHWHTGSEHTLDRRRLAMELHLVHEREDGVIAVVAGLYELGDADSAIQNVIDATPEVGRRVVPEFSVPAADYAPRETGFYQYLGSLTTPPCSELVEWYIAERLGTISERQAERLSELTGGANYRAVQPRNGRVIVLSSA